MRSREAVRKELERVEKQVEEMERVLGEDAQEVRDMESRLEVLYYANSLYKKSGGYLNEAIRAELYELLGRYTMRKVSAFPLSEEWRNLNAREWTIRWIMETNG